MLWRVYLRLSVPPLSIENEVGPLIQSEIPFLLVVKADKISSQINKGGAPNKQKFKIWGAGENLRMLERHHDLNAYSANTTRTRTHFGESIRC